MPKAFFLGAGARFVLVGFHNHHRHPSVAATIFASARRPFLLVKWTYFVGQVAISWAASTLKGTKGGFLDIAKGEAVEYELDAIVRRRHDQRVQSEGERAREQLWAESVRRYNARQEQDLRTAWREHWRKM